MSLENPSISEIKDALEGRGGPGNEEYYNDVLANASLENRAKAQKCLNDEWNSK